MNNRKPLNKRRLESPYAPNEYRTNGDDSGSNSSSVFIGLLNEVRSLRFSSFQICVFLWLNSKGFRSVRVLGRRHRVGRRSLGGVDFVAKLPNSDIEIAVQIRHWRSPLQPRVVDELRGHLLRMGLPLGLIVTTAEVLKATERSSTEYSGRPIQIVSLRQLCSSMCALELGVNMKDGTWQIDGNFFRTIRALAFAPNRTTHLESIRSKHSRWVNYRRSERDSAIHRRTPFLSVDVLRFVAFGLLVACILLLLEGWL